MEYLGDGTIFTSIYYLNSIGSVNIMEEVNSKATTMSIEAEASPTGFWSLNYAAFVVHRRNNWAVSVKGFNKFVWDFEASGRQNVFGLYQSHGALLVANSEAALRTYDIDNGWDWTRHPGTTTIKMNLDDLVSENRRSVFICLNIVLPNSRLPDYSAIIWYLWNARKPLYWQLLMASQKWTMKLWDRIVAIQFTPIHALFHRSKSSSCKHPLSTRLMCLSLLCLFLGFSTLQKQRLYSESGNIGGIFSFSFLCFGWHKLSLIIMWFIYLFIVSQVLMLSGLFSSLYPSFFPFSLLSSFIYCCERSGQHPTWGDRIREFCTFASLSCNLLPVAWPAVGFQHVLFLSNVDLLSNTEVPVLHGSSTTCFQTFETGLSLCNKRFRGVSKGLPF